jgi:type IV pilus assembly protein PilV
LVSQTTVDRPRNMNINSFIANKNQTGSTLIEVLIALLIFTVGLQGIASMQYQSVKDNFDSSQRSYGVWAAQELINRIRANPDARSAGNYNINANPCDGSIPPTYCADRKASGAAICMPAQMATFDIWESLCPTPNQAHRPNFSQLIKPNIEITCDGGATCATDDQFTLTLQWESKSVSDDATTDDSLKTEQFQQVFRP